MTRIFLGVDPGKNGGLAAVSNNGILIEAEPMPEELVEIWNWFRQFPGGNQTLAVLERVGGFMGTDSTEGSHRNKAAAHVMFNFGANAGALEMALVATGIPYDHVLPQKWTAGLGIVSRKAREESRTRWKGRLWEEAKTRCPGVKILKPQADAVLLALYCRQLHGGR